ncbi:MAG TPA: DNA primase [Chromatiaceae bacterium]|jgi:hypothetical protein|nr:DNA primase [Chromatiaceae bacterium]
MNPDDFIARLDGYRNTGTGKGIARCPAHEDRSPSLAVKQVDDGRILVHCFAGCSAHDVVESMGLTINDLFSEHLGHHFKPTRNQISHREAWLICKRAFYVLVMALSDVRAGNPLSDTDAVDRAINQISRVIEGQGDA